ncbi:hypothetical protein GGR57DRAFT_185932 [Xylariaceae sp. FL1272]|nr:hypothetical protein GGR57DRAFT_185932 [Xylariaceae sp. FL1272]
MPSQATSTDDIGRPLSVKEISERADNYQWNANIPLKTWLRTAQTLYQEGNIYLNEGKLSQAYLLYLRYTSLMLDHLRQHPEVLQSKEAKKALKSKFPNVTDVLHHLEKLKPIINDQYEAWHAAQLQKQARASKEERDDAEKHPQSAYKQHASRDPALSSASRILDAGQNQDLAIQLAQREFKRRDEKKKTARQAGISAQEEQTRRAAGFWHNWTDELADRQAEEEEIFRRQMTSSRQNYDANLHDYGHQPAVSRKNTLPGLSQSAKQYSYPSITKSTPVEYDPQQYRLSTPRPDQPPLPPKKPEGYISHQLPPLAPELPAKTPITMGKKLAKPAPSQELPSRPPKVAEAEPQPVQKQQGVSFKPAAYLENGSPIRPVFLPRGLRRKFLDIASENTKKGLEMCGILCGTAVNNALFIRCLLIPEQKCTSDTCETVNESAMLDYCLNEDLLVLGWIHTHPTQTCFMSSRDLHTQSGYQVMLPESIAIVCAPKFEPSYGIFRLTNPPGLPHILECNQSATFHTHSVDNLYTGAEHPPGHVYEHDNLDWYVEDIRPEAKPSMPSKKF